MAVPIYALHEMALPNLELLLVKVDLCGRDASAALALPDNKGRCLFENAGAGSSGHHKSVESSSIVLYLHQPPKDITKGFVFGSDPRSCDVLLANTNTSGISANHFSIRIDWVSQNSMIVCLSSHGLGVKIYGSSASTTLLQSKWQILETSTTTRFQVTGYLDVIISVPDRGNLQGDYERSLSEYFQAYKNAVPDLANISLDDKEVTPLILIRNAGLEGREYYPTMRIETGDLSRDTEVILYDAKCRPMPDASKKTQGLAGTIDTGPNASSSTNDIDAWLGSSKDGRPGQIFAVKHYLNCKTEAVLPPRLLGLLRLHHSNIEDMVDMIWEKSPAFMVVTEKFSVITLHALHHANPLRIEEIAFVVGQIFAALQYLHGQGWTHDNLDPRSIQVMSRNHLWVKLTDIALSSIVDLGKPEEYHALYASQVPKDQGTGRYPADIWSAGVVALQLLLPSGLPQRKNSCTQAQWVSRMQSLAKTMDRMLGTEAMALVNKVLKYDFNERPTATEVLEDPWLVRHRGEEIVNNSHFNCPTPVVSRHTSVDPSDALSRQGSVGPSDGSAQGSKASKSHHASSGPSRRYNTQSPSITRESVEYDHVQGVHNVNKGSSSRGSFNDFSRQSSIDPNIIAALQSRPDYGDDWNDFDSVSEHRTSASRRSHGTATPLAPKVRSAVEDNLGGKASAQSGPRSRHSHSRSSRGGCSEQYSTTTQSSRFTANPLAREPDLRTPIPTAYTDIPGRSPRQGSICSPPHSKAARSPAPSLSTDYGPQEISDETSTPGPSQSQSQSHSRDLQSLEEEDEATSAVEPTKMQQEPEVSEDHAEEMETDEGAPAISTPITKPKPRAKNGRFLKVRKGEVKGKGKGRVEK